MKDEPVEPSRPTLGLVADNGETFDEFDDDPLPVEIPEPQSPLTPQQRKVWRYVGQALVDGGLIHRTDALMLMVIVRTYCRWIELEKELEKFASVNAGEITLITDKGYRMLHPLFHAAQQEKSALLKWLPEAALTVTSYRKARAASGSDGQPDLFTDQDHLQQHIRSKPRAA